MCPKRGCVGSVTRGYFHHMLGDDLEPVLLAITWRNVVGREIDPHGCPRSLVASLNPRGAALIESSVERSVLQQSRGRLVGCLGPSQGKRRLTLSRTYHGEDRARCGDHVGSASEEEKAAIIQETYVPGISVSLVARPTSCSLA